jgi:hypothetical protein
VNREWLPNFEIYYDLAAPNLLPIADCRLPIADRRLSPTSFIQNNDPPTNITPTPPNFF